MKRLVDLCKKTDDFHLSDFREMRHLKRRLLHCIFCSNGHQLGCLFEILWQTNHISDTLRYFIALIRSSNTLREHDNISPDHSSCSFPMKFGKKLSKTLFVILQLQKRYRHKLHIAQANRGKLPEENKRLITYTSSKLSVVKTIS